MSSTLEWEPLDKKSKYFPDSVKYLLRKKYGNPIDCILSETDIPYLEGLRDAGQEEIQQVIDIIEKYLSIHVKETY